ncbi:MAG: hypothetical protein ACK41U_00095 [Paracoccus sp. (in: a-proteobacteria)]|uniref:hypothetical protein n=1 Tax=Paracoccus sp. TaxID=267 RepID=UPI00391B7AA8
MGRDRKNENRQEKWTKLHLNTMRTEAWKALPRVAQALYPWLLLEWSGPKGNNNGKIRLSVRDAAKCMGCAINTASNAFHDLQAKGFICITEGARLGVGGEGKSPSYEITELAMPGAASGRKLYKNWSSGNDYPVTKAQIANTAGNNGKKKARHQNEDSTVIKMTTYQKRTSSK